MSPITYVNGRNEWTSQKSDKYLVTGVLFQSNRRFKIVTDSPHQALGINLWRGTVWLVRGGRRYRIKSVYN